MKKHYKHTEEAKRNISKSLMGNTRRLGKHHTEETINKMRERMKGNTYKLGKHLSEETKLKMSKAKREKSNSWKGGLIERHGRTLFRVPESCKFSSMKETNGYVQMHRLVMAECLQKPLKSEEVVHHINGDITDNRIENLMLFQNDSKHQVYHWKLKKIKGDLLCI